MNFQFKSVRKNALSIPLDGSTYMDDRIGYWGNITAVDSQKNKVRILDVYGIEHIGIPVVSYEWVNKNAEFVSGSRNLPPIGARVFVLTPTHTDSGSFVLCSGFAAGDTDTHSLWEEKKETESKKISAGGWVETENYENGNKLIEDKDKNIQIELLPGEKNVKIKAYKYTIKIDSNGITIDSEDKTDIEIKSQKNVKINSKGQKIDIIADTFSVSKNETGLKLFEVD